MRRMIEPEVALAINRDGWNQVAPLFHGGTALPEYGPLSPTEDTLTLLDEVPGSRVLELVRFRVRLRFRPGNLRLPNTTLLAQPHQAISRGIPLVAADG